MMTRKNITKLLDAYVWLLDRLECFEDCPSPGAVDRLRGESMKRAYGVAYVLLDGLNEVTFESTKNWLQGAVDTLDRIS